MRRTKIVCTIGPASETVEKLKGLMLAGMNVARLNFSHGIYEEHLARIKSVRQAAGELGKNIGLLLDTKGPEIRTGIMKNGEINLIQDKQITITTEDVEGTEERFSVSYKKLPEDVSVGSRIMLDDGLIGLRVDEINGSEILCTITNGGILSNRKGVNVPGVEVKLPYLNDKDVEDIKFGIKHQFDFIAASFIRNAEDVLAIRRILEDNNAEIDIIAKIESEQGVNNLDGILKVVDGVMVARGDLGVEIPTEEVPIVQKHIIELCNQAGKPVITATQMLDSMIRNPTPTRAEATDVANAIFDGTDAVMLSGETAIGKYPIQAVEMMSKIAIRAEEAMCYDEWLELKAGASMRSATDAISYATCTTARNLGVSAIITSTQSGSTARMISKYRPKAPVVAATPKAEVIRKLALSWGIQPLLIKETNNTDEMFEAAIEVSLAAGAIKCGDLVVITAGVPVGVPGTTNLLKVHTVGEAVARGAGIGDRAVTAKVRIVKTLKDLDKVEPGDIIVCVATAKDYMPALEKASAIIAEEGGLTSHAAIVGLNLGIPVVVGVDNATDKLEDGQIYTIDGRRGLIYRGATTVL